MRKILLLILLLLFFAFNTHYHQFNLICIDRTLNIENVEKELKRQHVQHVDIVLKQVKLETGHLKHVKNNNLFGFRGKNGYLKFDTWEDAVAYKKRWQKKKYKGGDYYEFLKRVHYAEDSNYIKKLKQM